MANYQTTEDIVTRALKKAGEPTNGNSSYTESIVEYLSDIQRMLVAGGTIFDVTVDEVWPWAKADQAIVLEVLPAYKTGTITLTNGSNSGAFSSAPTYSVAGWFLRDTAGTEAYRIAYHSANNVNFTLETNYLGTSTSTYTFEVYKLDYEVLPNFIFVTDKTSRFRFSEDGDSNNDTNAFVTPGAYTPDAFATALQAALNSAGNETYTVTYDTTKRLFEISSAGATFQILGERGSNSGNLGWPLAGFNLYDYQGPTDYLGEIPFGSLSRIVEPIRFTSVADNQECLLEGVDPLTFTQYFTYGEAREGTPTYFTKIKEDNSGKITIRLNNFPTTTGRLEIIALPTPIDLQNNRSSVPLLPPKYYPFLECAAVYFLMLEKEDNKKEEYSALAKVLLQTMQKHYRGEEFRTGGLFGFIAPRGTSSLAPWNRRFRYGYDKDRL